MILDIVGSANEVVSKQVRMSSVLSTGHAVRVSYFHFPDLPLFDEEKDAISVTGTDFTVPAVSSIQELVNVLDTFVKDANRVFYAWYDDNELELCTGVHPVTLSASFAARIKMPTTLAATTCYSAALYEKHVSTYSHFVVRVGNAQGEWDGDNFNEFIAKIRRNGEGTHKMNTHYFSREIDTVVVDVFTVKKDGTITPFTSPEIWALGLEITM